MGKISGPVIGAEAEIAFSEYLGRKTAVKSRIPKKYRNETLDSRIRKERTKQEALLLQRSKIAGVPAPFVFKIDKKGTTIVMEKVEGPLLKKKLSGSNYKKFCREIGSNIAKLHGKGIVHGDLTTSNMIVKGRKIVFIDFGLGFFSNKIEDFAVDLLNFRKTYEATHFRMADGWKIVCESYSGSFEKGNQVIKQIEEVEKRVRYSQS